MSSAPKPCLPYGRQTIREADIGLCAAGSAQPLPHPGAGGACLRASGGCQAGRPPWGGSEQCHQLPAHHLPGPAAGARRSALTSPITFVASANCCRYSGAAVDFVGIDPTTALMNVAAVTAKLEQASARAACGTLPKVVVAVHLAGSSCDRAAIGALAERYGFALLEDANHAIGGRYQGEPVGNCRHSAITVFSYHPVKIVTTGEGGLATTNDPLLAQRMAELRSQGIVRGAERFGRPAAGPWVYEQQHLGINYRITDIQAALGLSQLKKLNEIVAERNQQLQRYWELLADLPVQLLEVAKEVLSSVHLAVIRLQLAIAEQHRQVFESLRATGIAVQLHYSPVPL